MLRNKLIQLSVLAMLLVLVTSAFAASEVGYDRGSRRDPFMPLKAEVFAPASNVSTSVKLEGIIYDPGGQSMAMLNGKAYQMGEAVGDAKVVKISKDHVVISEGGEDKTLWIREEEKT
jgi:hypothetical protein